MNQRKALFVDDDRFILDMYALRFTKSGYEASMADSAEAALKLVRGGYAPDVMLVDIVMPGMDGLEFVSVLRKENLASDAVLVFLTNQGGPDDMSRARRLSADGYIVKATTIPSEVLAETERIYSGKRGQTSAVI